MRNLEIPFFYFNFASNVRRTMKLRFSINYNTQWGESLHIMITYTSSDGIEKSKNLLMNTEDGCLWTLEAAAVESRQHPIRSFSYFYQVEDSDGQVLRKEWNQVRRTYLFDSTKDYIFPDQWRDVPLPYHLYSQAYATTQLVPLDDTLQIPQLPLFRRTIIFRVSAPQLRKGQSVAVCGSHPALGSWSPARYQRLEYCGQHEWMWSLNVDAMMLPLEFKYVVIDDTTHTLLSWEEGDNRSTADFQVADGQVLVLYGDQLRMKEHIWRAAGVVIPVFSLRSNQSYGVGDFGDLKRCVDWAVETGMKVLQILPVNDTSLSGDWADSYPYNLVSVFALHPHYLDIDAMGSLKNKSRMTVYYRQRQELNNLPYSDYMAVDRVKMAYVKEFFDEQGEHVLASKEYKAWGSQNEEWLSPYANWLKEKGRINDVSLVKFLQYQLHLQLKEAADYARSRGVVLMGDLPIGVNQDSVETYIHPEYFHLDTQTGAPPDAFSPKGQNWGFPTYNWDHPGLIDWFKKRYSWMQQYFDAIRIDHILGFFRIWEIPSDAIFGLMGHFSPALPLTASEIEYFGLPFRKEFLTKPFINDQLLNRLFGIHATYVRETFLNKKAYGFYDLKEQYNTQLKVRQFFDGKGDENSLWIRDGLYKLIGNVLFIEDPRQPEMYHPRIMAYQESVFDALNTEEKDAYFRLYNNYFYQRHNMFWGQEAIKKLTSTLAETRMLICAEDLGMLPDCVAPVLDTLRILSLEIQFMPKQSGFEFAHLEANPYRSVATISTHDMPPLRLWWEESPERTQRYYVTMLQKQGRAPQHLPAHLAEEMIARHLYCPSMLCLLSFQDWMAMDTELRSKQVREERINVPSDPYNHWQYRMHITLEELMKADRFNSKLRTMITRSKR